MFKLFKLLGIFSIIGALFNVKEPVEETFNYVSFGASQTSGFGIHGFLDEPFYSHPEYMYPNGENVTRDGYYSSGYIRYSNKCYPVLVKNALEAIYDDVTLHQCAINSMRAYDLAYILNQEEFPADDYIRWRLGDEQTGWIHDLNRARNETLNIGGDIVTYIKDETDIRSDFRKYITSADFITYDLGVNDFGVYLGNNITSGLNNPNKKMFSNDLHHMIGDSADKFYAVKELLEGLIGSSINEETLSKLDFVIDTLAYSFVGFVKSFDGAMKIIYELNPDVEVVVIEIQNMFAGVTVSLDDIEIDLGTIFGYIIDLANVYTTYLSPYADKYYVASLGESQKVTYLMDDVTGWSGNFADLTKDTKECFYVYERKFLPTVLIDNFLNTNGDSIYSAYCSAHTDPDETKATVISDIRERLLNYIIYLFATATKEACTNIFVDVSNADDSAMNNFIAMAQDSATINQIMINYATGVDDSTVYLNAKNSIHEILMDPIVKGSVAMIMATSYGNTVFLHPNAKGHETLANLVMKTFNDKKIVKFGPASGVVSFVNKAVNKIVSETKASVNALLKAIDSSKVLNDVSINCFINQIDHLKSVIAKNKLDIKSLTVLTGEKIEENILTSLDKSLTNVKESLLATLSSLFEEAKETIEEIVPVEEIIEIIEDAETKEKVEEIIEEIIDITPVEEKVIEVIEETIDETKENVEEIVEEVVEEVTDVIEEVVEETEEVIQTVVDVAETPVEEVSEIIDEVIEEVKEEIVEVIEINEKVEEIVEEVNAAIVNEDDEAIKSVPEMVNDVIESVKEKVTSDIEEAVSTVEEVANAVEEVVEEVNDKVNEFFDEVIPSFQDYLLSIFGKYRRS